MRRFFPLAVLFSLSLLSHTTPVRADSTALPQASSFSWVATKVPPSIALDTALGVGARYMCPNAVPDKPEFVQITDSTRRGNVNRTVFYGWRLHYKPGVGTPWQPGLTLLINGSPAVDGLWGVKEVVAAIHDPVPRTP
jgi:hypothetical protein